MRLNALFRLAFATATPHGLTLPHIVTRRLILQKARGHFTSAEADTLPRLVGTRFQVLFHDPSPGCFSPFPHGTSPLSVTREYSGLGGGPPGFTRNSTGSVLLGNTPQEAGRFHLRDCHPLRPDFPDCSATPLLYHSTLSRQRQQGGPSTPHAQ